MLIWIYNTILPNVRREFLIAMSEKYFCYYLGFNTSPQKIRRTAKGIITFICFVDLIWSYASDNEAHEIHYKLKHKNYHDIFRNKYYNKHD